MDTIFIISWYTLCISVVVIAVILTISEIQNMRYKYISKEKFVKKREEFREQEEKERKKG